MENTIGTPPAAPPTVQSTTPPPASPPVQAPVPEGNYATGGTFSDGKIQWVAIGIFAISILGLAYKAIYYQRKIAKLGHTEEGLKNKIAELEKNIRAVRGDKYESNS